ncbi:MAG: hypothetical protein ACI8PT_001496 [Gammaproteobacteria bacterium]|jgi:hypothetical protein
MIRLVDLSQYSGGAALVATLERGQKFWTERLSLALVHRGLFEPRRSRG